MTLDKVFYGTPLWIENVDQFEPAPWLTLEGNTDPLQIYSQTGYLAVLGAAPLLALGRVIPGTGNITLTTIWFPQIAAGSLTLSSDAPTVTVSVGAIVPTTETIALNGVALTLGLGIAPPVGSLILSGVAPTAVRGTALTPGVANVSLTGVAPTLTLGTVVTPSAGQLVLSGLASALGFATTPPVGAITLSGTSSILSLGIAPLTGSIVLSGQSPTVTNSGNSGTSITPNTGALLLSGLTPALGFSESPIVGSILFGPVAPILSLGIWVSPSVGSISLNGIALSLGLRIAPGTGSIPIQGVAPPLAFTEASVTGNLMVSGTAPSLITGTILVVPAGTLQLQGSVPTVGGSKTFITVGTGSLQLLGDPSSLGLQISTSLGSLALTGQLISQFISVSNTIYLLPLAAPIASLQSFVYLIPEAETID